VEDIPAGEDVHLTVGGVPLGVYEERSATGFNAVANTWTHAAVVCNAGVFTVYKDGVSVAASANFSVTAMGNRTAPVNVGYRQGWRGRRGGGYFTGDVDEVRIYNRALSAAEVQAIYAYCQ
jgi:hypothetical protein